MDHRACVVLGLLALFFLEKWFNDDGGGASQWLITEGTADRFPPPLTKDKDKEVN